ncbi:hypothetical protein N7455_000700 [Penicillium solitum]|uniref:uncharacterized protein n=1 Tax=Penicillium solitum TaxID=60172 RepID=UPI0032C3FAAE|nr:hypothetical protein N7455_000700 [Penicillium solitum]
MVLSKPDDAPVQKLFDLTGKVVAITDLAKRGFGLGFQFPYPPMGNPPRVLALMNPPMGSWRPLTGPRKTYDITTRRPPATLRRVGPQHRKKWIAYESHLETEFLEWWKETEYGQKLNGEGQSQIKWSTGSRHADVWKHFDQVADIDSGRPRVICQACLTVLDHPQYKGNGTSAMSRHKKSNTCRKGKKKGFNQSLISDSLQNHFTRDSPSVHRVTTFQIEEQILKTITCLRLPFQTVENPVFQRLLSLLYSGPGELELPSAKTLRRRLRDAVNCQQELQLQDLPEDAKVSLALDCWTSPFQQAFMAITVYFIDKDWNYREMLLGFEPLHGPHTGNNLSDVLHRLLEERKLLDRIFSVTTDNATNNDTMIRALQERLLSIGAISSRESIVRVPCMAHVIQLCLKQLLGHIRAAPKNKEVRAFWSDTQAHGLKDSINYGDVAHTLTKIRSFAIFVNASPQRRDAFLCLQSGGTRLFPLHDVQTRWNSTFLMLRRARRLRNVIDKYCCDHEYSQLKVTDVEWRQIDYLVHLTKPFFQFTMALMKTRDVTIHSVFLVYRKLLEHIERSNRRLKRKTTPWKKDMYGALLVARQKLKEYYEKTYRDHGFLYGTGTLLAPQYKLSAFDDREYSTCHEDTSKRYCEYLRASFTQYQQQNPELLFRTVQRSSNSHSTELDRLLEPPGASIFHEGVEYDEVDQYLREANVPVSPRLYWKEHEREFPVLSRLARDLLSVPATGAGVERLFNSARDICHYRRGSLHEGTIQDLMMYMCSEKLTLEGQQLIRLEKPLESESQEALEEDEALKAIEEDAEPISDNEEIEESENLEGNSEPEETYQVQCTVVETGRSSIHRHIHEPEQQEESMEEDVVDYDEADLLPPPIMQLSDRSQKRSSGRVTMPSSRLRGYEIALLYRTTETTPKTAEELASKYQTQARAYQADVTKPEEISMAINKVAEDFGRLDVIVANAGICSEHAGEEYTSAQFQEIMDVNVNGAFHTAQAAARIFKRQGYGNVVFTASVSALLVNTPQRQAAYNASKAGVLQLAKSLAVEWVDFCRVNSVSPGYIQTQIMEYASKEMLDKWLGQIPARRFASPYELKGAYLFCASDASSYMTGSNLVIDGGFTLP